MLISGFRGRQPTGEVSHKPISELPVLSARPAVTFPDSQRRGLWSGNWHVRERTAGDWTCEPQIANPVIRLLRHVPRYLRYLHAHCWTSLQSDQNLRGPHAALQQKLSIDICSGPTTDLSSKPAGRRCFRRSTGETDRQTDGHSTILWRLPHRLAYYADRVVTIYYTTSRNGPIHRGKWRHRVYGHDTNAILWV